MELLSRALTFVGFARQVLSLGRELGVAEPEHRLGALDPDPHVSAAEQELRYGLTVNEAIVLFASRQSRSRYNIHEVAASNNPGGGAHLGRSSDVAHLLQRLVLTRSATDALAADSEEDHIAVLHPVVASLDAKLPRGPQGLH